MFARYQIYGDVAELVDALVLGTSGAIRGGSSPLIPTNIKRVSFLLALFIFLGVVAREVYAGSTIFINKNSAVQ